MKFLFALLGVALAAHSYLPQANPLQSETEYRYRYDAVLTSGLPMPSSDSALTRLRSEVIIQLTEEKVNLLTFLNYNQTCLGWPPPAPQARNRFREEV